MEVQELVDLGIVVIMRELEEVELHGVEVLVEVQHFIILVQISLHRWSWGRYYSSFLWFISRTRFYDC